ncbi:hypothetical protein [Botrimarina mediterranea]|uniref:hypothetical protein n=1 Tax=Botrimarina mediterranea TaxID=2528022 RepID=UPI0011880D03|nr:hypothetical protein K2D_16640 [Planctomycetes bacterium K2D]
MISSIQKLLALLNTIGSLGSLPIGAYIAVVQQVMAAIQGVADAKTAADFHTLAANVLRPIVTLTTNPWDNGALLAIEALGRDPAWLDWCNEQMQGSSFVDAVLPPGIPEGAMAITQLPPMDLPDAARNDVQQFNLLGGLAALDKIRQLLPVFLAIVELLRGMSGTPQPLTDE